MARVPLISDKCLTCGERKGYVRGCCATCHRRHAKQVYRGQTTWKELERQGLVAAPRPRGRPPKGK
jgi:hypothetical protein